MALEFGGRHLACYWLERFPADGDAVKTLKESLVAIAEQLTGIDAEIARRLLDADC